MLSVEQCGRVNEMLILKQKKKEIFVKNKEKKTREMAANVKLFADRTNVRKPKKKQQSKESNWVRLKTGYVW